jgi:hypothetical protein
LKIIISTLAALIFLCGCSATTSSKPAQPVSTPKTIQTPEALAFEAELTKANAKNSNHKLLQKLAGSWDAEIKIWSAPNMEPKTYQGSELNSLIFDGLFLKQEFSASINNKAVSNLSFLGFDNFRRAFTSFTLESGSPQIVMSRGSISKSGKILTFSAVTTDPVSRLPYRIKSIMTLLNDDQRKLEVIETYPNGDTLKTTEILFTKSSS